MSPVVQTLAELVSINSVNAFYEGGPGEGELANYVESFFHQRGIETWRQSVLPGRDNVIAKLPGRDPSRRVVYEAHLDTVSVKGMAIPPFTPTISNGNLHGRGACDTKAGLAGMMHALADLKQSGAVPPCEVWLAAAVDEEYSFRGALRLCEGLTATAAIVAEPTELRIVTAHKGALRWRIVTRGKSAHSAKTHLGINAISHMAKVIAAFDHEAEQLNTRQHPLLGPATLNIGLIRGGTQVNFVPDECAIEIDRRMLPDENVADILNHYQQTLDRLRDADPQFQAQMEPPMMISPGLDTPTNDPSVIVAGEILQELGGNPTPSGVPYGSDASKLSRVGVPSIVFGPGSIDQAHAADEYVAIDQVDRAFDFYRAFLQRFAG